MLYKMTKQRFAHHDDIYPSTDEGKERMAQIRRIEEEEDNSSDSSDSSIDVCIGSSSLPCILMGEINS